MSQLSVKLIQETMNFAVAQRCCHNKSAKADTKNVLNSGEDYSLISLRMVPCPKRIWGKL